MTITPEHEYRFIDKSTWGDGPWQAEPDKVQWQDADTGLVCLAVRHPTSGHWCGYVGVPEGHPAFGLDYDEANKVAPPDEDGDRWFDVHGGLTFADFSQEDGQEHGICHVPQPGQPERVWWLGWDAIHAGDYSPAHRAVLGRYWNAGAFSPTAPIGSYPDHLIYRTLEYVQAECTKLAKQVAEAAETATAPAEGP